MKFQEIKVAQKHLETLIHNYVKESIKKFFEELPFATCITINMRDISHFNTSIARKYLRRHTQTKDYVMFFYYGWFICSVDICNTKGDVDIKLLTKKTRNLICNRFSKLPITYLSDNKTNSLFIREHYV